MNTAATRRQGLSLGATHSHIAQLRASASQMRELAQDYRSEIKREHARGVARGLENAADALARATGLED